MLNKWFPEIQNEEDTAKLTKQGAIAVLIFAFMNLLAVLLAIFANTDSVKGQSITPEEIQNTVVGAVVILPILLIFSWRIYKGKGWFVAGLTFAWFLVEIGIKVTNGTTNIGWLFAYFGIASMLINGMRACWWLRSQAKSSSVSS